MRRRSVFNTPNLVALHLKKSNNITQIKEEEMTDLHKEDKMHDALVDNASVKSDPENMNDDELVEHEGDNDSWDQ